MADVKNKNSDNIPGPFYVDDQCIACDACVLEAPNFFQMNDTEGRAYVFNQPKTEDQLTQCIAALETCPVDAIGKDGEGDPSPA